MLLIAHRGGTDKYTEQSLKSINYSSSLGADLVEADVRFTKEKDVPVICHDENTLRVFGCDKNVEDYSLNEFLTLSQIKDKSSSTFTLSTLLEVTCSVILLHIKVSDEYLEKILSVILEKKAENRVVLGVSTISAVEFIKNNYPEIKVLAFMKSEDELVSFLETRVDFIRLWENWVTEDRVTLIHSKGKKVWVMVGTYMTVGYTELSNLVKWKKMGVDGVLINEIEKAKAFLEINNG